MRGKAQTSATPVRGGITRETAEVLWEAGKAGSAHAYACVRQEALRGGQGAVEAKGRMRDPATEAG
jgi:hypothetical protein